MRTLSLGLPLPWAPAVSPHFSGNLRIVRIFSRKLLARAIISPSRRSGRRSRVPARTLALAGLWAFVVVLLMLDLVVFHRDSHEPTLRESAMWTVVWCAMALAFNGLIWAWRGGEIGIEFLTGYLVEWSLSMDNVFVFAVIFSFFGVPLKYQYRVLFWGILGAIVMRLTFILLGTALLERFDWVMPIFGAVSDLHRRQAGDAQRQRGRSGQQPADAAGQAAVSASPSENHGERFFVVENGRRCITPLFLVLLVIESTDVLFAVDSVPAIFGITQGSVHRVHFQYLRHPRPAGAVLPAGRRDGPVPLSELWAVGGADLRRREDGRPSSGLGHHLVSPAVSLVDHPLAVGHFDRGLDHGQASRAAGRPTKLARMRRTTRLDGP